MSDRVDLEAAVADEGTADTARPNFTGSGAGGAFGARSAAALTRIGALFEREMEAGRGFLWLPVLFAIGILVYFLLPREPSLAGVAALAAVLAALAWWRPGAGVATARILIVCAAIAAGLLAAKIRTDAAVAPVLSREMTVTVTGWITRAEATATGGKRIQVTVAEIAELAADATPAIVRVTVRTAADTLQVGDAVSVLANLSPPSGPVMPGGYDFSLTPFYQRIGGIGFAYGAAKPADLGEAPLSIRLRAPLEHLRDLIRLRIETALPGDNGAIAAALVMGDQRGIAEETHEAMRASGLGHILSISGLHMVLVAGSVFWLVRALLALSPALALRFPIKKWAAGAALAVATFYLGISGAEVATVRSYVMLVIILVAVLLDRRALTLRNVALAALVILVFSPESLLSISFQMSFAATVALIATYEAISARAARRQDLTDASESLWFGRVRAAVVTLFLTALIAGLATAPFGAYYFQRVAPLTIVANMAVAPVVGFVVMPMALLSVLLMPVGLEALPLWVMQWGLEWMLAVAHATATWSEGLGGVRALPAISLLLIVAGLLWLALWRERWRWAGVVPVVIAIPIALAAPRPELIVDEDATAVAIRAADGRLAILGGKGADFEVENWLRADGDTRLPRAPDLSAGTRCDPLGCIGEATDIGPVAFVLRRDAFQEDCRAAAVVVSRLPAPPACALHGIVIDRDQLDRFGAHALYVTADGIRIATAYPEIRRPFMPPVRD